MGVPSILENDNLALQKKKVKFGCSGERWQNNCAYPPIFPPKSFYLKGKNEKKKYLNKTRKQPTYEEASNCTDC